MTDYQYTVAVFTFCVLCPVLDQHHDTEAVRASAAETVPAHSAQPGAALLRGA